MSDSVLLPHTQESETAAAAERRQRNGGRRASDRHESEAALPATETDALTGLFNLTGWNRTLQAEEERQTRYGYPCCLLAIHLEDTGEVSNPMIVRAGISMRTVTKERDCVARVGPTKFTVLATECNAMNSRRVLQRIRMALNNAGVSASIGLAMSMPGKGLQQAVMDADRARQYRVP